MNDRTNSLLELHSPSAPVFLADIDRRQAVLRLHVRRGVDIHAVRERAHAILATREQSLVIAVEQHRRKDLTQPRSLEHWLSRLAPQDVVYDPMLVVTRARHLVSLAQGIRRDLGRRGRGIFFDASRHALVIVVRPIGNLQETSALVQRAVDEASRGLEKSTLGDLPAGIGIRIVSEKPGADLVPVDRLSASVLGELRRIARAWLAPVVMVLAGLAATGPAAASTGFQPVPKAGDAAPFGVLAGLSVLSDTASRSRLDSFSSAALEMYFGRSPAAERAVQLAQNSAQNSNTDSNASNASAGS